LKWTNPGRRSTNLTDADLNQFFLAKLAPLQATVYPSISAKTDADRTSYFDDVFQPEPIVRQDDMITSLIAIWDELGLDALVALEPQLRKMAKELRAPEVENKTVSDFVYAMY